MRVLVTREQLDPVDDKLLNRARETRTPETFKFGTIVHVHKAADLPTIHAEAVGYESGDIIVRGIDGKEYVAHYLSDKIWVCNCS